MSCGSADVWSAHVGRGTQQDSVRHSKAIVLAWAPVPTRHGCRKSGKLYAAATVVWAPSSRQIRTFTSSVMIKIQLA